MLVGAGDLDELLLEVRQELVERRVDQPDDDRQRIHRLEDALEVALLEDLELGHRGIEGRDGLALVVVERLAGGELRLGARGDAGDEDRATHDLEAVALAEHVLGAAQADALCAVAAGLRGLLRLVRVGPDAHPADPVRPAEDLLELRLVLEPRLHRRELAEIQVAGRAVEAEPVAFVEVDPGDRAGGGLAGVVDVERRGAGHARLADLARDDRGVRRGAAAGGDDALGDGHAVEVVRRRLDADEDDLLAAAHPLDRRVGVEDRAARPPRPARR